VSFLRAYIYLAEDKPLKAKQAAQEAIRIAHGQRADQFALLSQIYTNQTKHKKAWSTVVEGLRLDPRDKACLRQQLKLLSFVNPGTENWQAVVERALAIDPSDATFHAATGWLYWRKADYEQAQYHFKTALEINPMLAWAAKGMQESFKAENALYRLYVPVGRVLQTTFISLVPISGMIGSNLLKTAHEIPAIRSYLLFGITFVTALGLVHLLFDQLLWRHPIGRYTVTKRDKQNQFQIAGLLIGSCLLFMLLIHLDVYSLFI
jgi:tetratricopeptide (TPR) repeat protein